MVTKKRVTKKVFKFSAEEMEAHDKEVSNEAYRQAALCTIKKLNNILDEPIIDVLKNFSRYIKYLVKEYRLEGKK